MQKKVIIFDHHPAFAEGLTSIISTNKFISGITVVNSFDELLNVLKPFEIERSVIVFELYNPIMEQIKYLKKLFGTHPTIKVIVSAEFTDFNNIKSIADIGCLGYFLRTSSSTVILSAIECAINNKLFFNGDFINDIDLNENNKTEELTLSERELIYLISQQFSTKEIASKLNLSVNSIDFRKKLLFNKTNTKNSAGLVNFGHINNLM
jgi:DNA-binding NarL/FixJ family response regulator